jgi:hypothetical protein
VIKRTAFLKTLHPTTKELLSYFMAAEQLGKC